MRTLNISISGAEYNKFGMKGDTLSFGELLEIISKEILRLNLRKSVEIAEKFNLSKMTMEEISEEVKAVRNEKKVIIDTNVIVSSLIQKSHPFLILNDLFLNDKFELCLSKAILDEYFDVLTRPKFARFPDFIENAQTILFEIGSRSKIFEPTI